MDRLLVQELSVNALRRIDSACDRFEEAWRAGQQPRLEDYLLECDVPERRRLLESLQKLQQELILKQLERQTTAAREEFVFESIPERPVTGTLTRAAPKEPAAEVYRVGGTKKGADLHDRGKGSDSVFVQTPGSEQTVDWSPRVLIRVVSGPHEGEEFAYEEHNTLLVGRSLQAQLRLKDDPHFSRHHLRLEVNPPTCFLMDLRSRNGTFVNGERITERFLKDGDTISGGRTKMVVSISTPNANPGAVRIGPAPKVDLPAAGKPNPNPNVDAVTIPTLPSVPKSQPGPGAIRIAGYQIHEQIGAGDLGTVYRATRIASGEACALKVMTTATATDEKTVQTFLREASILNQLQHAHIVRMIEMGASGSDLYLSTEFVEALPWQKLVARASVAQRIRTACGLISQVLGALEYAHARSMVHRDVKPANILISRHTGKLTAKLADFGLAKQYTNAGMSQVTREGDVIGSLPYMSPEQFINSRDAKPACDIYSAGATLYWMLTGHEPILLDNHPCKFLAILEDAPIPIQQYCPEIPPALAQVIHRALEKTPEKRFQSAAEMRLQIRAFLK